MIRKAALLLALTGCICACVTVVTGIPVAAGIPVAGADARPSGFPTWVAVDHFVPPARAANASAAFAGTLSFRTTQMHVRPTPAQAASTVGGDYRHPWAAWNAWGYSFDWLAARDPRGAPPLYGLDATLFPGLKVRFFTSTQGDLVPVRWGVIRRPVRDRTPSFWELVMSPGKVWQVAGDSHWKGWNKAAFPFSLVQSQETESLLGLAFFYYKGPKVSDLYVQVGQDSGGGYIFPDSEFTMKAWAQVPMSYTPGTIPDEPALQTAYDKELADRWPMRPLSDLGNAVSGMGAGVNQAGQLTMGLVKDGTIYCDPVPTAFGDYPYPQVMRVGIWSASKSLIAGLSALRLAQKYGPGFLDTKLVSYFRPGEYRFASTAAARRWKMVTIRDALQMSTGMGPVDAQANWSPKSLNTYQWAYSYTLADQIGHYFSETPNPKVSGPGQKFHYMDQDMWAAALAMQRFLQQKEGPQATLLRMLRTEVLAPIGVHHFAVGTVYTKTGREGFPLTAWGALPTIDTLAKAGTLIAAGGKAPDGTQILDKDLIAGFFATSTYQLSFWNLGYTSKANATYPIPYMYGGGGNLVVCMPNGMVGIALGDNLGAEWNTNQMRTMVDVANTLEPF